MFIDGRMSIWRWEKNPSTESAYALKEYNQFLEGEIPFTAVVKKYNITTLLFPIEENREKEGAQKWAEQTLRSVGISLPKDSRYSHIISEAKKNGWKVVYQNSYLPGCLL